MNSIKMGNAGFFGFLVFLKDFFWVFVQRFLGKGFLGGQLLGGHGVFQNKQWTNDGLMAIIYYNKPL